MENPRQGVEGRDLWDCPQARWYFVDRKTGEKRAYDCKSWQCPVHGALLRWRWRIRLGGVPWQHFWTVTLVPADKGAASRSWRLLRDWLREKGVRTYIRVLEIGKGGMAHYHLLTFGEGEDIIPLVIPDDMTAEEAFKMEVSNAVSLFGYGSVVDVQRVRKRGAALRYVLGYVLKGGPDVTRAYDRRRRVVVSRDISSWSAAVGVFNRLRHSVPSGDDDWELHTGGA